MTTSIDYTAARERLTSITTDPAALASFERVAQSGDVNDEFLEAVARLNVSLDYIFRSKGEGYVRAETIQEAVALVGHPDVNVYALPADAVWPGDPGEVVWRCGP